MFVTLADLPSTPKPFPKVDCPDVTLWTACDYCDFLKTLAQEAGGTDGNSSGSASDEQTDQHSEKKKKKTHPYLQYKDRSLVSATDLSKMSMKVRSVWETLKKRRLAPKTFGKMTSKAWEFLACAVLTIPKFEFLLYCDDGHWKLKEWCKQNYSSWTRNRG